MLLFLLAHIGIPLIAGLVLVVFKWAAQEENVTWGECHELALDFAILSIGANGAIFINPQLIQHWGERTAIYGILVVLINLLLAGIVVLRGKQRIRFASSPRMPTRAWQAIFDLFFGVLALTITTSTFYFGYHD